MDEATRDLVSKRWNEYGIRWFAAKPNAYSGQGEAALARLLAQTPLRPGTVDATSLRANGVPALGGSEPE
jgi:hypothetical protein